MATPKSSKSTPTATPVEPPAVRYEEQLPEVVSIGMAPLKDKWVVYAVTTQGDRVVDRKIISDEGPVAHTRAFDMVRVACATEFLFGKGDLA